MSLSRRRWGFRAATLVALVVATVAVPGRAPVVQAAPGGSVQITYSVGTAGRVSTDVDAFASHVAATLRDIDRWSLGGALTFTRVTSGGSMHVLLTAPAVLGGIAGCSGTWSCRVGANVYINEDRWVHGVPTWTLGLDAYRHYVVNHEVGHFLGFGHASCPGAGRPAPVMMQQSKGSAPCADRVWPLASERQALAARRGVAILEASAAASHAVGVAYLRILQRWPTRLEAHLNGLALDRGGLSHNGLVVRLLTSTEFDRRAAAVIRLYQSAFDRRPDVDEVFYWSARMHRHVSLSSVAGMFVDSDEFADRYDAGGVPGFIDALYAHVLGRTPDAAGRAYWIGRIDSGASTRAAVLASFSESAEHRARVHDDVLVQAAYLAVLDRPVDPDGADYWTGRLAAGAKLADVTAFLRTQPHARL